MIDINACTYTHTTHPHTIQGSFALIYRNTEQWTTERAARMWHCWWLSQKSSVSVRTKEHIRSGKCSSQFANLAMSRTENLVNSIPHVWSVLAVFWRTYWFLSFEASAFRSAGPCAPIEWRTRARARTHTHTHTHTHNQFLKNEDFLLFFLSKNLFNEVTLSSGELNFSVMFDLL